MPSPRAILIDLDELGLPKHKAHNKIGASGRLKVTRDVATETAPISHVEVTVEEPVQNALKELKSNRKKKIVQSTEDASLDANAETKVS